MFRYCILTINILVFTPIFSALIILVGIFDKTKVQTSKLVKLWSKVILRLTNITYTIDGIEKINNDNQYIIISNHHSAVDILITFALLPLSISFFTKKELFRIPLFGFAMKLAGMVPVDRFNKNKSKKSVNSAADKLAKTNISILNYPEGSRMPIGKLGDFKKGGFILAIESKISILPITLIYKKNVLYNKIRLVVDNPIDTLNYNVSERNILLNNVRNIIKSNLLLNE